MGIINIKLVFPSSEMELSALNFKMEFFDNGEKTINGSYKLDMEKYMYLDWLHTDFKLVGNFLI